MSSAAVPQFTNEMLDQNFDYISKWMNRTFSHIRHLEGHIAELAKASEKPIEVVIVKMPKRRTALVFVAGAAVGIYVYKRRTAIKVAAENANVGAKMRFTEPDKFVDYTKRQPENVDTDSTPGDSNN